MLNYFSRYGLRDNGIMCGICGIIDGSKASPKLVEAMAKTLVHRGPDDEGEFVDGIVGLAARRLSIIDIAGGSQPVFSEDGRFVLVYNGEVYNHSELRSELESRGHSFKSHCDTEAALHALEDDPAEGVKKLRGMFTFALWDKTEQMLTLGRDRLGIKPLYYYFHGGIFAFASEIKALLEVPQVARNLKPDHRAVIQILTYNFPLGARTAFDNIFEVPPGHILVWHNGRVRLKQYWDVPVPAAGEEYGGGEEQAAEELMGIIRESVRMRLMSDVPLGTFLSGGPDSSIITACARETTGPDLNTFALSFDVPLWDESEKARQVADFLGVNHREIPCSPGLAVLPKVIWHLEQPQRWSGTAGIFQLYEAARRDVKVILTGEGADEIFGGYPHLTEFPLRMAGAPGANPLQTYLDCLSYMDSERRSKLFSEDAFISAGLKPAHDASDITGDFLVTASKISGRDPFNIGLYLDIKMRMVKFVNFMLDRLSMAHGVEARVPFLDHKLVEYAISLPPSLKVRPPFSKYILRRAARGVLPDEVLDRPKQGFIEPLDHWMRGELPPCIVKALGEKTVREKGYFMPKTVKRMMENHRNGSENNGYDLAGVAMVHMWDDLFIVGMAVEEIEEGA